MSKAKNASHREVTPTVVDIVDAEEGQKATFDFVLDTDYGAADC